LQIFWRTFLVQVRIENILILIYVLNLCLNLIWYIGLTFWLYCNINIFYNLMLPPQLTRYFATVHVQQTSQNKIQKVQPYLKKFTSLWKCFENSWNSNLIATVFDKYCPLLTSEPSPLPVMLQLKFSWKRNFHIPQQEWHKK